MNKNNKIWTKQFTRIFIASCVFYMGLNTIIAMIPKFANTMTDSAAMVGMVSGAFAFSALLLKVVAGPATDTFSKKKVILIAALVMTFSFFGYSLSNSIQALIAFRLIQGGAQAFTAIGLLAYASEFLPKEKMTSGIGVYSLGQTACQAIAPAFGLSLVNLWGYHGMCAVCGVFVLIGGLIIGTMKDDFVCTKKFKITLSGIAVKEAMIPAFVMGLLLITYSMISSYLLIYADIQGIAGISMFFTVNACVMLISRPVVGKLADKYGAVVVMLPMLAIFAASYFVIAGSKVLWVYLLAGVLVGFSYGACQPLVQSMCIKSVGPERRGSASNTNYIGYDMGNLLGPVIAGRLIDAYGYDYTWKVMTLPVILAAVVLILWRRRAQEMEKRFEET